MTERAALHMLVLDRETFQGLRRVLPAATKDCLRETFGVSETTWVKLRDGRPVKRSTLDRLLDRYRRLSADGLTDGAPGQAFPMRRVSGR